MIKKKSFLTPHDKISNHDKIIRFFLGVIIFFGIISSVTSYLQYTLFFKLAGNYLHWAIILFVLPSIAGLIQHIIDPPARLLVSILGAFITSLILYPIYSNVFWASPPSLTVCIFFTFIISGIGFTFSINPLDRHILQRKVNRHKRTTKTKTKSSAHSRSKTRKKKINFDLMLNSSLIRTFELMLTVIGFILGIWGTISMGVQN